MEPNTGPAKCSDVAELACCSPHLAWGTMFLVVCIGVVGIYLVAGTVHGFQNGKDGIEALPNIAFWIDVGALPAAHPFTPASAPPAMATRFSAHCLWKQSD